MNRSPWPVIAVVGGCGGAGASSLAALLACHRAGPGAISVLLDLDCMGGGIDILLGAETTAGARWSGLHATGDRLDPGQLRDGLPRWGEVAFLGCDGPHGPNPDAVRSVVHAARLLGPVVVDPGRYPTPARTAALADVDVAILIVPGEIRAVTAGAAQQASLDDVGFAGRQLLVARLDRPVLDPRRISEVLGLPLAGVVNADRGLAAGRDRGIDPARFTRATVALARELVESAVHELGALADIAVSDPDDRSATGPIRVDMDR